MKCKTILVLMILVFSNFLISAQEIVVRPNTNITVESGATLDITSGDLVLRSDATGDASLIDFGSITYSGGGKTNVERYLTEGRWHLISSPVSNILSGMFLDDYLQHHAETSNGWTDIASDNYTLSIMQGYALWSVDANPSTEVFSGVTNTGIQNRAFTQNGEGWNLIGNPYPSALDWDAITIPTELNGAIWLFDPTIGTNGDYVYYINGGGAANTTTQFIPSGQGFFVRATGGSGTLTFDNSGRVHDGQSFYKETEKDLLVLKVTGNDITTQTSIRFDGNATQQVDRLYDVFRILSDSPDVPMLFTRAETQEMAINTFPSIDDNEVVPLWFKSGTSGEYSIKATEIESFDSYIPIYIEDLQSGKIQNLRGMPEYSFEYKSGNERSFLVYFIEPENATIAGSNILIYAHDNVMNVKFPVANLANPNFSAQIMVFDIAGRAVLQITTTEINNQIPLKGNNSIYMVKVISGSETANSKVFIK